jgi:hypothetical protein
LVSPLRGSADEMDGVVKLANWAIFPPLFEKPQFSIDIKIVLIIGRVEDF